jgi:hypothetical protein
MARLTQVQEKLDAPFAQELYWMCSLLCVMCDIEAAGSFDITIMMVQAMVVDLGFIQTVVDKIVDYTEGVQDDEGVEHATNEQLAASAFAQGSRLLGEQTCRLALWTVPFNLIIMSPLWFGEAIHIPSSILSKLLLLRLVRLGYLFQYFKEVCSYQTLMKPRHHTKS